MDRFQRAALARQIDDRLPAIVQDVEGHLPRQRMPTNSRLNRISTSLDWHEDRQTPAMRLARLEAELDRLYDSVEERTPDNTSEWQFYAYLDNAIGTGRTTNDTRNRILNSLQAHGFRSDELEAELDLRLAQETLRVVHTLIRGKSIGEAIAEYQGAFPWQQ